MSALRQLLHAQRAHDNLMAYAALPFPPTTADILGKPVVKVGNFSWWLATRHVHEHPDALQSYVSQGYGVEYPR